MACGTPVIAYNEGAVPEIIEDGRTGFIVDNQDDAVAAVDRLVLIDRKSCRKEFEKTFSAHRMTSDYLAIYERIRSEGEASKKVTTFPRVA
jgi:glycosyltransferase involved in cell wall biosynthesis